MHQHLGRRRLPIRGLAAWCGFGAGVGVLLYLLLNSGHPGIPGWQPANESLRLTLAASSSPVPQQAQAPPPSAGSAPSDESASASAPASSDALPDRSAMLLDLNAATTADLDGLPGIGPSKARAIVDFRDSHKGFRRVEELLEVKGIGPKLYDKIRALVKVEVQAGNAGSSTAPS